MLMWSTGRTQLIIQQTEIWLDYQTENVKGGNKLFNDFTIKYLTVRGLTTADNTIVDSHGRKKAR